MNTNNTSNIGELNSTKSRLLVAVSHTQQSAELLVLAKELADTMHASLLAVYVENTYQINQKQQKELDNNISIAKSLGIEFRIISYYNAMKAIAGFALKEKISHIIIGKPKAYNLLTFFRRGDFVNQLIKNSGNIHVYILGSEGVKNNDKFKEKLSLPSFTSHRNQYLISSLIVILASVAAYFISDFVGYRVISFVLLFVVSLLAFIYGTGPILLASTLGALIWNFFFIPPHYTFHIDNTEDLLMFFMFFIIALLNGVLTSRVRRQEMRIRKREERTHALYSLTRDLSEVNGIDEVKKVVTQGVENYFRSSSLVLLKDEMNEKQKHADFKLIDDEWEAINTCFEKSVKCGRFTDLYTHQSYSYFPLVGIQMRIGVLVMNQTERFTYGEEQFWDAYLGQISGKFEREILRNIARKAYLLDESDKLYKTLFNSISHELRIPVTAIMGASDTLIAEKYPEKVQQELLSEINIASVRLNHLIENLLNMSRLESGRLSLRYDWCDVHDLINRVAETLHQELHPFSVNILIPDDLPMVKLDFGLMEQVIHNLLLNATQYAPPKSVINVEFGFENNELKIVVSDNGSGFPQEELRSVFNKFYRGKSNRTGGTGLGLSIAKGFVEAHKGSIFATNQPNGGAQFTIHIPIEIADINHLTLNE